MRTMYDSTTPADCPSDGDLYLYYCDGIYATTEAAVRALFPNAILVPISAIGTDAGVVGDCERFDMTPDDLVNWVLMRRAAGLDPTGYVNELNGWGPAKAAFAARGVPEPHWGVANYDGDPTIPAGAVFKQFRGSFRTPPQGTGAHYDQSSVLDYWPGVDQQHGGGSGSLTARDALSKEAMIVASADGINLFIRGTNNHLFQMRWDGTTWGSWVDLDGVLRDPSISTAQIGDQLDVYVTGTDGSLDYRRSMDAGATWGPWVSLGGNMTSPISVAVGIKAVASGGTEPPEPKNITLSIPSVPGTATGTIS